MILAWAMLESESRWASSVIEMGSHHQILINTPLQAGQVLLSPISVSNIRKPQQN
jgi:hypothetical protein